MKKLLIPSMLFATLIAGTSCGENNDNKTNTDSTTTTMTSGDTMGTTGSTGMSNNSLDHDSTFVLEAASGGLMEVTLGKLAATNASSAEVKKFGAQMVTDHSAANNELMAIAATKNITVPANPAEKHQKHIDELKTKKGAEFDKAYMRMMVEDHEEDVSKFEKEATDGGDADVKAFAASKVPILKSHHEMAKGINDKMK